MTPRSISRFLCLLFVTAATARAQTGTIAGRVVDSTTSAPLSGATIRALSGRNETRAESGISMRFPGARTLVIAVVESRMSGAGGAIVSL